ncbi:MAG: hypothetical protein R3E87_16525 [Burkholderiaceae bacterium]
MSNLRPDRLRAWLERRAGPRAAPCCVWLLVSLLPAMLLAWALWQVMSPMDDERWLTLESGLFVMQQEADPRADLSIGGDRPALARPVVLPHDWRARDGGRIGWYLFDIDLTVAPDRAWGVWLPRVSHDARVFVNGLALAGGLEADARFRNVSASVLRRVANGMLTPGVNRIAIQVMADRPGNGFLGPVRLGPYSVLFDAHQWVDLVRVDSLRIIVAMMVAVSALTGLLWFWRRQDTVFGWFAAMMLTWAMHDLYPLLARPDSVNPWLEWFWHATLVCFVYSVALFVFRFVDRHDRALERRIGAWALLTSAALLPIALLRLEFFHQWAAPVTDTAAMLIACYPFLLMGRSLLREPSAIKAGMVAAGSFPLVLGLHDWLVVTGIWVRSHGYLMPYGSVLIMVVFGGHLTLRFGRVLSAIETMNLKLEERVREREQELAIKHARLVRLETERALLEERSRLMTDMHDGLGGTLISTLAMVQAGQTNSDLLAESLREAIADLRLMIDSLDPVDGDIGNVLANMRTRIEPKLRAAGMRIEWAVGDAQTPDWLGATGVLQVMRVVQEAINNVLKHAQASRLRIVLAVGPEPDGSDRLRRVAEAARLSQQAALTHRLDGQPVAGSDAADERADTNVSSPAPTLALADDAIPAATEDAIWVAVIDDGVGLARGTHGGGRGMGNMRRRAGAIGAELRIVPAEPGTCVMLRIPLQAPAKRI